MSFNFQSEEYYKRFIELQEKLRKSEEERLKLEMKFNEMVRITREEEQMHYRKLRAQYKRFLDEDRRRQDRNERILRTLERIESRVAMLVAKTDRFKLLRQQYQTFLNRIYEMRKTEMSHAPPPSTKENENAKSKPTQDTNDVVQTYLQNLSSNKLKEMLKKEGDTLLPTTDQQYTYSDLYTFSNGESRPNRVNSFADDIMNSIYSRTNQNDRVRFQQPREFNNNIALTPDSLSDVFKVPKHNNYVNTLGASTSSDFYTPAGQKNLETSAAEDTDTEDFSESEEILYKNPAEFTKGDFKKPDTKDKSLSYQDTRKKSDILPRRTEQPNLLVNSKTDNLTPKNDSGSTSNSTLQQERHQDIPESEQRQAEQLRHGDTNLDKDFTQPESLEIQDKLQEEINSVPEQEKPNLELTVQDKIQNEPLDEQQSEQQYIDIQHPINQDNTKDNSIRENVSQPPMQQYDNSANNPVSYSENVQEINEEQPIQEYDESQVSLQYQENYQGDQHYDAAGHQQYREQYEENDPLNQQYQRSEQISQPYDDGSQSVEHYDEKEQPLQQYDVSEQPPQQYDDNGQLIQQYDEHGQPFQQYDNISMQQYDENGQPLQQYDENGQPLQEYEASGQPTQQYNEHGQAVQQYENILTQQYDENGQPLQQYDENGQLIQYDENGQLLQQYEENDQPLQQYDNIPTQQYDENIDSVQVEQGQYVQRHDEAGQPVSHYGDMPGSTEQYDEHGQIVQPYDQQYAEGGQFMQPYGENLQYDENGQLIHQQYDEQGQLIQGYDEHGQVMPQYDENGQLIEQYGQHMYDENQHALQQYDENGQLIHQTDGSEFGASQPQYEESGQFPTQSQVDTSGIRDNQLENVTESVPQEADKLVQENTTVPGEHVEPKKAGNVMEMLDTDTESTKQDTKISHDSDFDFSNG